MAKIKVTAQEIRELLRPDFRALLLDAVSAAQREVELQQFEQWQRWASRVSQGQPIN